MVIRPTLDKITIRGLAPPLPNRRAATAIVHIVIPGCADGNIIAARLPTEWFDAPASSSGERTALAAFAPPSAGKPANGCGQKDDGR